MQSPPGRTTPANGASQPSFVSFRSAGGIVVSLEAHDGTSRNVNRICALCCCAVAIQWSMSVKLYVPRAVSICRHCAPHRGRMMLGEGDGQWLYTMAPMFMLPGL